MGKQTLEQKSKLMIARDKFCDADFDRLVIDTSRSVARRGFDGTVSPIQAIEQSRNYNLAVASCELTTTPTIDHDNKNHDRLIQPKRPMNAFMVWGQAIRRELHHKFSNVQNALLSKALGRVWRSLDSVDKEPFVRKANMIKANHKRDYPNYRYQPRRVQERRVKNKMLIGINLNHPVNQHQCQQVSYSSASSSGRLTTNEAYQSSSDYYGHLDPEDGNRKLLISANWRRNPSTVEAKARDLSKDTNDGVQTFEYHPYPSSASAATDTITIECNNCRPATNNGCQNEVNCREGQHQTPIYPPYQQLTYNMQHHHHHHQHQPQQHYTSQQHLPQQQSLSYEVAQLHPNHHLESCHRSINNDTAGLYYGGR